MATRPGLIAVGTAPIPRALNKVRPWPPRVLASRRSVLPEQGTSTGSAGLNTRQASVIIDLARAAGVALKGALATEFAPEPLITEAESREHSVIASAVKRHGVLIQQGVGLMLEASERYDVLHGMRFPITAAAVSLIKDHSLDDLRHVSLPATLPAGEELSVDLVVMDKQTGWAAIIDVKRGNGRSEGKKCDRLERGLRAAALVAGDVLRQRGFARPRMVQGFFVDYYGQSGIRSEVALVGSELDGFFEVPITSAIDAMTNSLGRELQRAVRSLRTAALQEIPRTSCARRPAGQ
jgi:hypothetical protein